MQFDPERDGVDAIGRRGRADDGRQSGLSRLDELHALDRPQLGRPARTRRIGCHAVLPFGAIGPYGSASANSLHSGGVNLCFADGSVHFIKSIDQPADLVGARHPCRRRGDQLRSILNARDSDDCVSWRWPGGSRPAISVSIAAIGRSTFSQIQRSTVAVALFDPLQFDHVAVQSAAGHELVVAAGLGDRAVVEDEDPVGVADRAQAVRDHERGPAAEELVEALLNQAARSRCRGCWSPRRG